MSPDGRYLIFGEFVDNNEGHLGLVDLITSKARYIVRQPGVNNLDAGFSDDRVCFLNAMAADGLRLWWFQIGAPFSTPSALPIPGHVEFLSLQSRGRRALIRYRDGLGSDLAIFADHFNRRLDFTLPGETITNAVLSDSGPRLVVVETASAAQPRRYYMVDPHGPTLLLNSNQSGIDNQYFVEARSGSSMCKP